MTIQQTVLDKQGRPIGIHDLPNSWKITPFQRDCIYQGFLRVFPTAEVRRGILKECLDERIRARALAYFENYSKYVPVTADRIYHFVSEAVAAEAGYLPRLDRWDWWVGCSLPSNGPE